MREAKTQAKVFMIWTSEKIKIWVGWIWDTIIDQAEVLGYPCFGDLMKVAFLTNLAMVDLDLNPQFVYLQI